MVVLLIAAAAGSGCTYCCTLVVAVVAAVLQDFVDKNSSACLHKQTVLQIVLGLELVVELVVAAFACSAALLVAVAEVLAQVILSMLRLSDSLAAGIGRNAGSPGFASCACLRQRSFPPSVRLCQQLRRRYRS